MSPFYKKTPNPHFIHVGAAYPQYKGPFSNINAEGNDSQKMIIKSPDFLKLHTQSQTYSQMLDRPPQQQPTSTYKERNQQLTDRNVPRHEAQILD